MNTEIIDAGCDISGGYKVDVSRGENVDRVSSEWFSRPDDERYLSLDDLFSSAKGRAERSRTRTVESAAIRVEAHRDNPEKLGLVWTRLIFPDGRSLVLERQPGADAAGYAGLEDRVDNHWASILRAAGLSTLLAVGAELSLDEEDRLARALRDGALDTINEAGQRIVQRQLEVPPTVTIRPGFPVRVIVTRDLVFAPPGG